MEGSRVERAHQAELTRQVRETAERKQQRERKAEAYYAPARKEDREFLERLTDHATSRFGWEVERLPAPLKRRGYVAPLAAVRRPDGVEAIFHRYYRNDPVVSEHYVYASPSEVTRALGMALLEQAQPGDRIEMSQGIHPRLPNQKHRIYTDDPNRVGGLLMDLKSTFDCRETADGRYRFQFESPSRWDFMNREVS